MLIRQDEMGYVRLPIELTEGNSLFNAVRVDDTIVLTAVEPAPTLTIEEAFGRHGAELVHEALEHNEMDRRAGIRGRRITDLSAYFTELDGLL